MAWLITGANAVAVAEVVGAVVVVDAVVVARGLVAAVVDGPAAVPDEEVPDEEELPPGAGAELGGGPVLSVGRGAAGTEVVVAARFGWFAAGCRLPQAPRAKPSPELPMMTAASAVPRRGRPWPGPGRVIVGRPV
ncbi:MAG: hypothetical protein ACRDZX_09200 [Acidimicrobiales bacterium]